MAVATNNIPAAIRFSVADGFAGAAMAGIAMATSAAGAIGAAIASHSIGSRAMLHTNESICLAAQRSAFAGFTNRTPRRGPAMRAQYAALRRSNSSTRASGALGRAIRDRRFWEATSTEIRFINTSLLNQEAKHWKRLNFGAGEGAIRPPGQFQLALGSQLIGAAIGLEPDPRPGFTLPKGFFVGPDGKAQPRGQAGTGVFIPQGKTPKTQTYGIVTTNFLDAGVKRLLKEIGEQYTTLLQQYIQTLGAGGSAVVAGRVQVRGQAANKAGRRPDIEPKMAAYLNANLANWLVNIEPHDLNADDRYRRLEPPKPLQV